MPASSPPIARPRPRPNQDSPADILERVLDEGIVVAGPENVERGLAQLVLTVVELLRQIMPPSSRPTSFHQRIAALEQATP